MMKRNKIWKKEHWTLMLKIHWLMTPTATLKKRKRKKKRKKNHPIFLQMANNFYFNITDLIIIIKNHVDCFLKCVFVCTINYFFFFFFQKIMKILFVLLLCFIHECRTAAVQYACEQTKDRSICQNNAYCPNCDVCFHFCDFLILHGSFVTTLKRC